MIKKEIVLTIAILLFLIIPLASAEIQFFDSSVMVDNHTIAKQIVVTYYKNALASGSGLSGTQDFISSGRQYEAHFGYDMYVKKWNEDAPNYTAEYCTLTILKATRLSNFTSIYSKNITGNDIDDFNDDYFVKLSDGDSAIARIDCKFYPTTDVEHLARMGLITPSNLNLKSPTLECKACQYYEWSVNAKSIQSADVININRVSVSDYIKKFILLNFEIIVALFWVLLILLLFASIGTIFILFYWAFLWLKHLSKK